MKELKPKEKVSLTNGSTATIVKELGRGGQGIVYLVEVGGQKMALKSFRCLPLAGIPDHSAERIVWIHHEGASPRLF